MASTEQHDKVTAPESPTTARPLEMDDDDVQEPGGISMQDNATSAAEGAPKTVPTTAETETAPPKPPRPQTEQQKNEAMLKEAFPSIDAAVIKAVLMASGNRVDPAFNALLQMTDPEAAEHEPVEATTTAPAPVQDRDELPPQPPRPQVTPASQMEADELYARQLAQHYDNVGAYEQRTSNPRTSSRTAASQPRRAQGPPKQTNLKPNELYDNDHSFFDDDLPVIRENLRKGFQDTQNKVTDWFNKFTKQFDDDPEEGDGSQHAHQRPGMRGSSAAGAATASAGRMSSDSMGRRSRDYERYDADPQVLSDDFAGMRFHGDGTPARQPTNPNLFRPPSALSSSSKRPGSATRKVAFKDGSEEDLYGASPMVPPKDGTSPARGGSKWQPLSTADPTPIAENDPFSLGDSDDDKDAVGVSKEKEGPKSTEGTEGIKMTETESEEERLRRSTAEAMEESLKGEKAK